MRHSFPYRKTCVRLLPCLIPKRGRPLVIVPLCKMMCHQFGLKLCQLGKSLDGYNGNARMQLAPATAKQRAVSGIPHQSMLEQI